METLVLEPKSIPFKTPMVIFSVFYFAYFVYIWFYFQLPLDDIFEDIAILLVILILMGGIFYIIRYFTFRSRPIYHIDKSKIQIISNTASPNTKIIAMEDVEKIRWKAGAGFGSSFDFTPYLIEIISKNGLIISIVVSNYNISKDEFTSYCEKHLSGLELDF